LYVNFTVQYLYADLQHVSKRCAVNSEGDSGYYIESKEKTE